MSTPDEAGGDHSYPDIENANPHRAAATLPARESEQDFPAGMPPAGRGISTDQLDLRCNLWMQWAL